MFGDRLELYLYPEHLDAHHKVAEEFASIPLWGLTASHVYYIHTNI